MYSLVQKKKLSKKMMFIILSFSLVLSSFATALTVSAAVDPDAPQNFRIVPGTITHNSVDVEWDDDWSEYHFWDPDNGINGNYINSTGKKITGLQPETTYNIYTTFTNNPTAHSDVITFKTQALPDPNAPQNFRIIPYSITHNSVDVEWDDGWSEYHFWDPANGINGNYVNSTGKKITGLQPETTYNIYTTFHPDYGDPTAHSYVMTFTTLGPPDPDAPQNFRIVPGTITHNSVDVEWDDDWSEYHFWDPANGINGNYTNGNGKITGLEPETTYNIYTTFLADSSHRSNVIRFTTLADDGGEPEEPAPTDSDAPQNFRFDPDSITHDTVNVDWDSVGWSEINVFDDTKGFTAYLNKTNPMIGGLEPDTEYTIYAVWEKNKTTKAHPSNVITFRTAVDDREYPDPPLTPPSHFKVTGVTANTISFSWGSSPGATGYDLYVNGGWKTGTWSNEATSITIEVDATVTEATYATFAVGAQNPPFQTPSSNSNTIKLTWGELEAPRDLQVVTSNRSTATLAWAPTPGAMGYVIYKDDVFIGTSDSNRYVATRLTEGQSYTFKVVANNSLWESPDSDSVKVVPGSNYNIVTYFTSWTDYSNAELSKLTHINYAFSDLCWREKQTLGLKCQDENIPLQEGYVYDGELVIGDHGVDLGKMAEIVNLRNANPHLKLLTSVGGWSWSKNFSNMAATEITRRTFANSVVKFIRAYGLDGLDVDWEYPVEGGESYNVHRPEDKQNFTLMMQTVREALDAAGSEDGQYYLLTIASGQGDNFVVNADLVNSVKYLDFINIMTYDYSGTWDASAYHLAPLYYDKNNPSPSASRFNVYGGVAGHLNGGVPNYKLQLGLPFYGKGWLGCPPDGQYQLCAGGSVPDFGTRENRTFDFWDIEDNYADKNGYVRYWNEASKVPYLYNAELKTYISYNDVTTMKYSASMVKSLDLAGVMSWEISGDRNKSLSTQLVSDLPIEGTINASALAAPEHLTMISNGRNAIKVGWSEVDDATGYEVFANKTWIANTTDTEYTIGSLNAGTNYIIEVLAVERDDNDIIRVSAASNSLSVKTTAPYVPPAPGPGPGPGPAPTPDGDLDTDTTTSGDATIVKVKTDAALKTIKDSSSSEFKVVVEGNSKVSQVVISPEVLAALAEKGDDAVLTIVTDQVEYSIPLSALHLSAIEEGAEVRITIETPDQRTIDQLMDKSDDLGLTMIVDPLDFKIEIVDEDGETTEIVDFGNVYISRVFKLDDPDLDTGHLTGVFYDPETDAFRPVPTVFTTHSDGTISADLMRSGNSIYTIIESNFNFQDVMADWAQNDIELATAKLIVSGVSDNHFGGSENITRAEFVSMIVRALGLSPNTESSTFNDVNDQTRFTEDIKTAKKIGIINGRTHDIFDPNGLITRQEIAAVIERAMTFTGKVNDANPNVLDQFSDHNLISSYAKASLAFMVEQHIINGVSPTRIDPLSNATKAQATVMAMRMLRALGLSN